MYPYSLIHGISPAVSDGIRLILGILSGIRDGHLGTGVWDTEDAAFRIDLPNGEYEVTCRFQSNDGKAHRIELYANGRRVSQITAPSSNEVVEGRFTVEVTDGTLIQVIHAAGSGRRAHWVWSGFNLRRMEAD